MTNHFSTEPGKENEKYNAEYRCHDHGSDHVGTPELRAIQVNLSTDTDSAALSKVKVAHYGSHYCKARCGTKTEKDVGEGVGYLESHDSLPSRGAMNGEEIVQC